LAAAKFIYGTRGANLDILARQPLWECCMDYKHGTGHGVGYLLNVHEGPNSFRWRIGDKKTDSAILEDGMITSNEPGIYVEDRFGIRLENLILCKKSEKNIYGQFMEFENLTLVPFEKEAIDVKYMSDVEIELLNKYHQKVYITISQYLSKEEKEWLKDITSPLTKHCDTD
jgi:Xaa-Pro aminopeptidase